MLGKEDFFARKTRLTLKILFFSFLALIARVGHLTIVQKEQKQLEAQKPQQRTIVLKAHRGTLWDRFHTPLALNRIGYNATLYYRDITQVPRVSWKTNAEGKKERCYPRREYIHDLSQVLAKILDLDPQRVEDQIHAKASLIPHAPYLLKQGLSEEEFAKLKMLESQWLGIHAETAPERFYPLGKTGCHLLGTLGSINSSEYQGLWQELKTLQESVSLYQERGELFLPQGLGNLQQVYQRLDELRHRAYTLNDWVGKSGIEKEYEEQLRGYFGKKTFQIDQKGRFIQELCEQPPLSGSRLILSLSAELQQFAENLLIEDEKRREGRSISWDPVEKTRKVQKQPWMKGGAIVAMDPSTGEILALASTPRFDPNDFISSGDTARRKARQKRARQWLESETLIQEIWEGKQDLVREVFMPYRNRVKEEKKSLTWNHFLKMILPDPSPLFLFFQEHGTVQEAIRLQEDWETLLYFSQSPSSLSLMETLFPTQETEEPLFKRLHASPTACESLKRIQTLLSPLPCALDRLLTLDLLRTLIYSPAFPDLLIEQIGSLTLSEYFALNQLFQQVESEVKPVAKQAFHTHEFQDWRKAQEKEFLKSKRQEEKQKKLYTRPYLDYLDQKENELFEPLWREQKFPLILNALLSTPEDSPLKTLCEKLPPLLRESLLRTFRSYRDLNRPLLTCYGRLRNRKHPTERDLAASFYPVGGYSLMRSYAFQSGSPQGSLFKLVTGYEALRQGHNPIFVDRITAGSPYVAYTPQGVAFPRFYKGGRLPKSHIPQIGTIDLVGALEQSSNPYFSLLAGDFFNHPSDLIWAGRQFGFGEKTGIDLPGEVRGHLPSDVATNRTGLYSTAMGQHTLLNTPLQTACMLAAIANGGKLVTPKLVKKVIRTSPNHHPLSAFQSSQFFAQEELKRLGVFFPLFTAKQENLFVQQKEETPVSVKRTLFLSPSMRSTLLEGMDRATWGSKGTAHPSQIRTLLRNPLQMHEYVALEHQLIGKTGTSEILYNPSIVPSCPPRLYKHIWFGGIAFSADPKHPEKKNWNHPELVVVVFLRYGDGGKEAAPLAARIVHKWREIQKASSPALF